eukprot:COSAG02_NODE_6883_length_3309_cov_2.911838_1_plen_838_part_00
MRADRPAQQQQPMPNHQQQGQKREIFRRETDRNEEEQPVQTDQNRRAMDRQQHQERLVQEQMAEMRAQQQVQRRQSQPAQVKSRQMAGQQPQFQQKQLGQQQAREMTLQQQWEIEEAAATQVQAAFRGRLARVEYDEMLVQQEMQRLRAREAKERKSRDLRLDQRRREAKRRLQDQDQRWSLREEAAATHVQAAYRGHRARIDHKERWAEAKADRRLHAQESMRARSSLPSQSGTFSAAPQHAFAPVGQETSSVAINSQPLSPGRSPDQQRGVSPSSFQGASRVLDRQVGSPGRSRYVTPEPTPKPQPWKPIKHSPIGLSPSGQLSSPVVQMDDGLFPWPFEPWEESVSLERFLEQVEVDPMVQQATGIGAPPSAVRVAASCSPSRNTAMSPNTAMSSERVYHRRRVPSPTRRNAGRRPRSLNETARKEGRWCHADQPTNTKVLPRSTSRMPEDNPMSPPRQHIVELPISPGDTTVQTEAYTRESATPHTLHRAADEEQLRGISRVPYNTMEAPPPALAPAPPPLPQLPSASSASARSLSLMPAASSEQQPRVDSGEVQRGALLLELKRSATGWGSQTHDELVPAALLRETAGGTDIVTPTDRELKQAAAVLRSTPAPAPKSKKAPPPSPRMRSSNASGSNHNTMAAPPPAPAPAPPPPPPPPPPPQLPSASSASARSLSLMPAASSEQQPRVDSGEVQRGALLLELKRSATGWGSQTHDELVPAALLRETAGGTDIVTPTDRELKQAAAVLRSTPAPAPKSKKAPPPSPRMRSSNASAASGPDQSPARKRSAPPVNSLPGPSTARARGGTASRAQPSAGASPPPFPDGRMPQVRHS